MRAMVLRETGCIADDCHRLTLEKWPKPVHGPDDVLIRVAVCGVCHTEVDEIEGRTAPPRLPIIPGHQVVGTVVATGRNVKTVDIGERVGVAWIFSACGECSWCRAGQENLCPHFRATGRDENGGYADYMTARAAFVHPIPDELDDVVAAAPLLCAGSVGYRSLFLSELSDGQPLGFMGFGASAHLVLQLARRQFPNSAFYVFAPGKAERDFALELGAVWVGEIDAPAPEKLKAIIDTTPAWAPVVAAMDNLQPGGRLVINAIRKENTDKAALLTLDYARHLWMEKEIKSVANVTREDVGDFLQWAAKVHIVPDVLTYDLSDANIALADLKAGRSRGAKVLIVSP